MLWQQKSLENVRNEDDESLLEAAVRKNFAQNSFKQPFHSTT